MSVDVWLYYSTICQQNYSDEDPSKYSGCIKTGWSYITVFILFKLL